MHELLIFLEGANTNAMIIVIAVVILALFFIRDLPSIARYIPLFKKVEKISDVQDERTEKADELMKITTEFTDAVKKFEETLAYSNKIATNHTHELPDMKKQIDKIADGVEYIKDNHGNRLTRLETLLDK